MPKKLLVVRQLGLQSYEKVLLEMHNFTNHRTSATLDEIWLVQHPKIFTKGPNFRQSENILYPMNIPIIQSDRGGQITFHAPGQQIVYFMLDIYRRNILVHDLVKLLEKIVISTLSYFSINSHTIEKFPGVYVDNKKICSIGLRIRKGCCFHGISLNVCMDLKPFSSINPCGCVGLKMTQVSDLVPGVELNDIEPILIYECLNLLEKDKF